MKYTITFPQDTGQWAGTHYFSTKRERRTFIDRNSPKGMPIERAIMN